MRNLAAVAVLCVVSLAQAEDHVIADFENGYGQWVIEGDAFGAGPARGRIGGQQDVMGYRGDGLVNTFLRQDESTGTLTSPKTVE